MNQNDKFSPATKRLVIGQVAVWQGCCELLALPSEFRQHTLESLPLTGLSSLRARKFGDGLGTGSIDKVDDGPFAPVQEPGELAKVWRGHVIIYGVEIAVIRHIQ
jgi:hypothetical protein